MSADGPFELQSQALGALPIVGHFLTRMRLSGLLERYLPAAEARSGLAPARAIGLLVCNLCVSRAPLYGLAQWAAPFDPRLLGLEGPDEVGLLNDDRVGRALERLFDADRASLLTELMLGVIAEFGIDCSRLHNDSTSISVHGEYRLADGREREGKPTVQITFGHSKDHRPDLKQLMVIVTVSADGAVPLALRLADGNTADATTHIASWEGLRALTGRSDFLYVADCKLVSREQMAHIDTHGGRFLSVLPRSRTETQALCRWTTEHTPAWREAARCPGARKDSPDDVWSVASAPIDSAEGYRIVWVHSTRKHELDHAARADAIARAIAGLDALSQRLAGPKPRFHDRAKVENAAVDVLRRAGVQKLIRLEISEHLERWVKQHKNGKGNRPRRRTFERTRFTLRWQVDQDALDREATAYGCFALITNDRHLTDAGLLTAYRYQPNLEKRHHQLKSVQDAAPIFLKNPARIEGLFVCHFIALLCCALIERHLRQAMTHEQIHQLPLYPEHRSCSQPTATRTLELFSATTRHQLTSHGQPIQTFQPQLTPLQTQLLHLLDVPAAAYTNH
jgi:transposase